MLFGGSGSGDSDQLGKSGCVCFVQRGCYLKCGDRGGGSSSLRLMGLLSVERQGWVGLCDLAWN